MRSISYGLTMLLLASMLSACGSQRVRAPIVSRTGEPVRPVDGAKAEPPMVATTPEPGGATPVPADSGVQTAPVRSGGIESRPLDSRAAATSPTGPAAVGPPAPGTQVGPIAATQTPPAAPIGPSSIVRTGPKGLKRPYSDAVLAEVKAADAAMKSADLQSKPADANAKPAETAAGKPEAAPVAKVDSNDAKATAAIAVLTFDWPSKGKVLQGFSEPKNIGIVLDGKSGDPVVAVADGRVIFSGPGPRGYGNLLIVKHDTETVSVYGHNKTMLVKEGQAVKRGQKIAEIGDTGADRVGLLFEIRKQGNPVDPQKLLPKR